MNARPPTVQIAGGATIPLVVLSLILLAALVYLSLPGSLLYPAGSVARTAGESLALREDVIGGLEARIAQLRVQLEGPACAVDRVGIGLSLPPDPSARESAAPRLIAPALDSGPPPENAPSASGARGGSLLERLDAATVLVLVPGADGLGTGSGFFVSRREVMTNRHVVEGARGPIFLASRALGRAEPARLVAATASREVGGSDFALLRLDEPAGGAVQPLTLASRLDRLDSVVAAGFPFAVLQVDQTYQSILEGDTSRIADLALVTTQGTVMAMPQTGAAPLITHSASISPGNSGGPLVDACGRVVGINTFVAIDRLSVERLNFSVGAAEAAVFAQAHGVPVSLNAEACGGAAQPVAEAPSAAIPAEAQP